MGVLGGGYVVLCVGTDLDVSAFGFRWLPRGPGAPSLHANWGSCMILLYKATVFSCRMSSSKFMWLLFKVCHVHLCCGIRLYHPPPKQEPLGRVPEDVQGLRLWGFGGFETLNPNPEALKPKSSILNLLTCWGAPACRFEISGMHVAELEEHQPSCGESRWRYQETQFRV